MALRNILKDGDPSLLKKSRDVTEFNDRLHVLLDDMRETLTSANGLGLAAVQVGVLRRAAIIVDCSIDENADSAQTDESDPPAEEDSAIPEPEITEIINPEFISSDGEQTGSEGCLSFPGQYGMVTRPQNVKIKAQDRYGKPFEFEASGITARAVCHEINHLDGIVFTSIAERMLTEEDLEEMRREEEMKRDRQEESGK